MKMTMKKLLVLFLAAMLLLTASCAGQGAAQPDPEPGDSQKEALQEIENSPAEPESEEDNADETTPAETEPDETEPEESEPAEQQMVEKNGDIVILYTSDVHCGVDQGFGYAGLQQIRDYLISKGNDVILVDNGDGYTMFDGCTLLQDRVKLDNQVLIDYIMDTLGGVIGSEYEDVFGAGRIEIK